MNLVKRRQQEVREVRWSPLLRSFHNGFSFLEVLMIRLRSLYLCYLILKYNLTSFAPSTQAPFKSNELTRKINLKGSRKLQFKFTNGIVSGTSDASGSATGSGVAAAIVPGYVDAGTNLGVTDASGGGEFTSTSGSTGFIDTVFGSSKGSSAGGATGSQAGNAGITTGGDMNNMEPFYMFGYVFFNGTTTSSGTGSFGGGLSPVGFNTLITEVPGAAITTTATPRKSGKSGGSTIAFAPSTFTTTTTPFSTGPTGGFASSSGALDIASQTFGTIFGAGSTPLGSTLVLSSGGKATNTGSGSATSTNFFGSAGGTASGSSTGADTASGNGSTGAESGYKIMVADVRTMGGAVASFGNQGSGIFGTNGVFPFP
jgi:hypothetical protein